jgi:hypothetical protein
MLQRWVLLIACGTLLLGPASCSPRVQSPTPLPTGASPPTLYPMVSPTRSPRFTVTLDPIRAGDRKVSGIGPGGLPIRVVDISQMGLSLGQTVISQDGRFAVQLARPVTGGSRIGVLLSDLANSRFPPSAFAAEDVPLVGIVVASQLVAK